MDGLLFDLSPEQLQMSVTTCCTESTPLHDSRVHWHICPNAISSAEAKQSSLSRVKAAFLPDVFPQRFCYIGISVHTMFKIQQSRN